MLFTEGIGLSVTATLRLLSVTFFFESGFRVLVEEAHFHNLLRDRVCLCRSGCSGICYIG